MKIDLYTGWQVHSRHRRWRWASPLLFVGNYLVILPLSFLRPLRICHPPPPSPLPDDDNHDNNKWRRVRFPPLSINSRRTPTTAAICRNLNHHLSFIDTAFCFPPAVKLVVELFVPDVPPPPNAPKQCYAPPNSHPPRRRHIANISHGHAQTTMCHCLAPTPHPNNTVVFWRLLSVISKNNPYYTAIYIDAIWILFF